MNACVARPVGKKEPLQSKGAQASMKAEWDRLRSKVVWDENIVREWSGVAKEAQDAGVEVNFGYFLVYALRRTLSVPLVIQRGSSRGESFSEETGSLTKAGKLQLSKIWVLVPQPWKLLKPLSFTV